MNTVFAEMGKQEAQNRVRPILVHCSAGIGRTGTFLAICVAIEALNELIKLDKEIEINKTHHQFAGRKVFG